MLTTMLTLHAHTNVPLSSAHAWTPFHHPPEKETKNRHRKWKSERKKEGLLYKSFTFHIKYFLYSQFPCNKNILKISQVKQDRKVKEQRRRNTTQLERKIIISQKRERERERKSEREREREITNWIWKRENRRYVE